MYIIEFSVKKSNSYYSPIIGGRSFEFNKKTMSFSRPHVLIRVSFCFREKYLACVCLTINYFTI